MSLRVSPHSHLTQPHPWPPAALYTDPWQAQMLCVLPRVLCAWPWNLPLGERSVTTSLGQLLPPWSSCVSAPHHGPAPVPCPGLACGWGQGCSRAWWEWTILWLSKCLTVTGHHGGVLGACGRGGLGRMGQDRSGSILRHPPARPLARNPFFHQSTACPPLGLLTLGLACLPDPEVPACES